MVATDARKLTLPIASILGAVGLAFTCGLIYSNDRSRLDISYEGTKENRLYIDANNKAIVELQKQDVRSIIIQQQILEQLKIMTEKLEGGQ